MLPTDAASNSATSLTLMQRVVASEPGAWERLCQVYGPEVYGLGRRKGLQDADAADVVQDVFAQVFRGLPTFRRDRPGDSFRGWLYTIAIHKVIDVLRGQHGRPAVRGGTEARVWFEQAPQQGAGADPDTDSFAPDERVRRRAIQLELLRSEFSPRDWEICRSMELDGTSAKVWAAQFQISEAAVYKAKSRVVGRLRQLLEGVSG